MSTHLLPVFYSDLSKLLPDSEKRQCREEVRKAYPTLYREGWRVEDGNRGGLSMAISFVAAGVICVLGLILCSTLKFPIDIHVAATLSKVGLALIGLSVIVFAITLVRLCVNKKRDQQIENALMSYRKYETEKVIGYFQSHLKNNEKLAIDDPMRRTLFLVIKDQRAELPYPQSTLGAVYSSFDNPTIKQKRSVNLDTLFRRVTAHMG